MLIHHVIFSFFLFCVIIIMINILGNTAFEPIYENVVCEEDESTETSTSNYNNISAGHKAFPTYASFDHSSSTEDDINIELSKSKSMDSCNLSKLHLRSTVPNFSDMTHLKSIDLSDNDIENLELIDFKPLINLEKIYLADNRIINIPDTIFNLPSLTYINASNNNIRELVLNGIYKAPINYLDLSNNKLKNIPHDITIHFPKLTHLLLSHNNDLTDISFIHHESSFKRKEKLIIELHNNPKLTNHGVLLDEVVEIDWKIIYPYKILDHLFLGPLRSAQCLHACQELNITHVITLGNHENMEQYPNIKYLIIPIEDMPQYNISKHFDETYNFIENAKKSGGNALVHCFAGISRSATIVIAYIMRKYYPITLETAISFVKRRHKNINPNNGFVLQLEKYETKLIQKNFRKRTF
jgi:protein-tyrosine phosphatase